MNKIKIGSVIACVSVILICLIYYTKNVSDTMYYLCAGYPAVESCSARKIDAAPEGYSFSYYRNDNDLSGMEVVEVTWLLSNITNEQVDVDDFWGNYYSMEGSHLGVAEREKEDLAISNYANRKVIPPGEQTAYTDYVLVPEGCHEIEAKSGYITTYAGISRVTMTVTF